VQRGSPRLLKSRFQFLGRNSGRSDFDYETHVRDFEARFNSSVGILVVRTRVAWVCNRCFGEFQFLGRNSGRSDEGAKKGGGRHRRTFQFLGRNSGRSDMSKKERILFLASVSIPRSEFWSFGLCPPVGGTPSRERFNSSVGILVVRTYLSRGKFWTIPVFQFLGRNSGRSDRATEIPSLRSSSGFNSSVGILVVRTRSIAAATSWSAVVSIPRSEFWSFGPDRQLGVHTNALSVSIPRSEFWSFGREQDQRA